ncbi:MAG: tolB protein precursor, partial [Bacteroidetes bacterium]|nr:tolB protein precursor [Bacteroidota bacterium]
YQIWTANENQFQSTEADRNYVNFDAGTLPPVKHVAVNLVDTTLYYRRKISELPVDSIKEVPYRSKFKLDYISNNASIGVSTGMFRNSMGGSINAIFSDMVGNNQLYSALSLNGEIYDWPGCLYQSERQNQVGSSCFSYPVSVGKYVHENGYY